MPCPEEKMESVAATPVHTDTHPPRPEDDEIGERAAGVDADADVHSSLLMMCQPYLLVLGS